MRVVIVDNYDSFTYNLYQYVAELDERPVVVRNDHLDLAAFRALAPDRIILSPGPGDPTQARSFGIGMDVIRELGPSVPILGVCLGHQGIVAAFGGRVVRAPRPMHGKQSAIRHTGRGLFAGLPDGFLAMRYHSLVAESETMPACLDVTARTDEGVVMGVQHVAFPVHGIQFHPESIGTPHGKQLLARFLATAP